MSWMGITKSGFSGIYDNVLQCIAKNCYVTWGSIFSCCPDCCSIPVASEFSHGCRSYHLVMTNNLPWKIHPFLIGEPSISMGHLYHGYVSHNQKVFMVASIMDSHDISCPPSFVVQILSTMFHWLSSFAHCLKKKLIKTAKISTLTAENDKLISCHQFLPSFLWK